MDFTFSGVEEFDEASKEEFKSSIASLFGLDANKVKIIVEEARRLIEARKTFKVTVRAF